MFLTSFSVLLLPSAARAGKDMPEHYHLIYAAMLAAGFGPKEAKIIADASWSVDQNPDTLAIRDRKKPDIDDTEALIGIFSDPNLARQLSTGNAKIDELIFTPLPEANKQGWASRFAPAMVLHGLMTGREQMDIVFPKYFKEETKALNNKKVDADTLRTVQLILLGQYMHQVIDRFVHPMDPVMGHGLKGHLPDLAIHQPANYEAAIVKAIELARKFIGFDDAADKALKIEPADDRPKVDRFKELGLDLKKDGKKKNLETFAHDLVAAVCAGYDPGRTLSLKAMFLGMDWKEVTTDEKNKIKENLEQVMNWYYRAHNVNALAKIEEWTKVTYKASPLPAKKLSITYGSLKFVLVDNLSFWAFDNHPAMGQSMRDSLRLGLNRAKTLLDTVLQVYLDAEQLSDFFLREPPPANLGTTAVPRIGFDDTIGKDSTDLVHQQDAVA